MIDSVIVTNYLGKSIELVLAKPETSGFVITNIEGLGPVAASINTTKSANSDGSRYNSSQLEERNITMSLIFLDDGNASVERIRHSSYEYFPINRKVHLTIKTDERVLETEGYVESNDPIIFSNMESTTVSILCPDPCFYSPGDDVTNFCNIRPAFEFPFGDESLFEISTYDKSTETTVYYEGDYEVGISITLSFIGEAEKIILVNKKTEEIMNINNRSLRRILFDADDEVSLEDLRFKPGDVININTRRRNKSITLTRDGNTYNILNCLDKGTKWFTLSRGENVFEFSASLNDTLDGGTENVRMFIKNKKVYDGV